MKVETLINKDKEEFYPLASAKATVYSEAEKTVYDAVESLKNRVTDLENRPSGGGFGGTINAQVINTEVTVE